MSIYLLILGNFFHALPILEIHVEMHSKLILKIVILESFSTWFSCFCVPNGCVPTFPITYLIIKCSIITLLLFFVNNLLSWQWRNELLKFLKQEMSRGWSAIWSLIFQHSQSHANFDCQEWESVGLHKTFFFH